MLLKNIFLVFIILLIGVAIYFGIKIFQQNRIGYKNVSNADNIKLGMTEIKLLEIMGKPDDVKQDYQFISIQDTLEKKIGKFITKKIFVKSYYYTPPFSASSGIIVFVDTTEKKVLKKELFE